MNGSYWRYWMAVVLLSIGGTANAKMFYECMPREALYSKDPAGVAAAQNEACNAENAVYGEWEPRIISLRDKHDTLRRLANAGNWEQFKPLFDEAIEEVRRIQKSANANAGMRAAANLREFYSEGVGYAFQNVGLGSVFGLDEAIQKVRDVLNGDQDGDKIKAATAALSIIRGTQMRTSELAKGLAKAANHSVTEQHKQKMKVAGAVRKDKLAGGSVAGYVGGFGARIGGALSGLFGITFLTMVFVGFIAFKLRRPKMIPKAGVLAFGFMLVFVSLYVVLPWIDVWLVKLGLLIAYVGVFIVSEKWTIWRGFFQTGKHSQAFGIDAVNTGSPTVGLGAIPGGSTAQTSHGSARWGTAGDMLDKGHLQRRDQTSAEPGLVLGRAPGVNDPMLDNRFRIASHVATFAPTGSGKGIGAVLPNLLEYPGSMFVLDIKGENYAVTARARRELGHQVYLLDPFAITGDPSSHFNPLDRLNLEKPDIVGDAAAIAEMIVVTSQQEKGNHWNESATDLLAGLIVYVKSLDDPSRQHLGEVRRLLTAAPEVWEEALADMAVSDAAFGIVGRAANALLGKPKDERGSIISTAQRHTAFLDDPRIAAALARSDFSFDELKDGLITVYLAIPMESLEKQARFVRAVFGAAQGAVMSSSVKPRYKVVFLLDEFGQLGYVPSVETGISLIRGFGGVFWLFFQDLGQLKPIYPKWQSIMANTAKHFYGTADFETAKYISDSMGKATIEFETESQSTNSGYSAGGSGSMNRGSGTNQSTQRTGRDLLAADEVMRLGPTRPLVLISGEPAFVLGRIEYFNDPDYSARADPNPYHS